MLRQVHKTFYPISWREYIEGLENFWIFKSLIFQIGLEATPVIEQVNVTAVDLSFPVSSLQVD